MRPSRADATAPRDQSCFILSLFVFAQMTVVPLGFSSIFQAARRVRGAGKEGKSKAKCEPMAFLEALLLLGRHVLSRDVSHAH